MADIQQMIFIGYRRDDTADVSGRVFDRLHTAFGAGQIFKDVDNLPIGSDFGAHILTILPRCRVFLAMIGPGWSSAEDEGGARRLENAKDWVRIELETALATPGLQVVPVLVNGAQMPREEDLPPSLKPLVKLNAALVRRDPDFHKDMDKLIHALQSGIATGRVEVEAPAQQVLSGSAAAWKVIEGSLDIHDYLDFERHFSGTPEVMVASRCRRQLEAWAATDKSSIEAIKMFLAAKPFDALAGVVAATAATVERAAREASERALVEYKAREEAEQQAAARAGEELKVMEAKRFEEAQKAKEKSAKATRRGLILTGIVVAALLVTWGTFSALSAADHEKHVAVEAAADAARDQQLGIIEAKLGIRAGETFRDCSDCPELVLVPAGDFMMGSPESEPGRSSDEGPQRRVSVPSLAVGKYEVTRAEWDRCVSAFDCASPPADGFGGSSYPVTNVSWDEVAAYTKWLSKKTGQTYRLLSEAEWEYSARAGSSTAWSFGDSEDLLDDYAWYASNADHAPHEVGTKPANAFGLHDMYGNVSEWVQDCFAADYSEGQPSDGSAFTGGYCSGRVFRGGSGSYNPNGLRSAYRNRYAPAIRDAFLGFRVARVVSNP